MNKYIKEDEIGLEVGAGAGFSKKFIKNKNLKISDFSNHEHLDYKNVDAHNTNFHNNTFDYVIAAHVLHHVPYPIKFFKEMHRILKKDGKLLIHEEYLSVFLQIILIVMKHEGIGQRTFGMNLSPLQIKKIYGQVITQYLILFLTIKLSLTNI